MSISSFFRSFLPSSPKEDLPLSSRVSTLEIEMLEVRAYADRMFTTVKKLQGKVYRGVSLGDTVDETPPAEPIPQPEIGHGSQPDLFEKADLYRRAAQLRGR